MPNDYFTGERQYEIKAYQGRERISVIDSQTFGEWIKIKILDFSGLFGFDVKDGFLFYSEECAFPDARFYVYEDGRTEAIFIAGDRLFYIKSRQPLGELIKYINSMEVLHE